MPHWVIIRHINFHEAWNYFRVPLEEEMLFIIPVEAPPTAGSFKCPLTGKEPQRVNLRGISRNGTCIVLISVLSYYGCVYLIFTFFVVRQRNICDEDFHNVGHCSAVIWSTYERWPLEASYEMPRWKRKLFIHRDAYTRNDVTALVPPYSLH
jgi:hypothetical protein